MDPTPKRRGKKNADDLFLMAYACGATVEQAAVKAGISKRTAYRRLRDPECQRQRTAIKAETVRRTADLLTASNLEAAKSLLDLQRTNTPPSIRLGAARAIIELGARLRENSDLLDRIAALEKQVNEQLGSKA